MFFRTAVCSVQVSTVERCARRGVLYTVRKTLRHPFCLISKYYISFPLFPPFVSFFFFLLGPSFSLLPIISPAPAEQMHIVAQDKKTLWREWWAIEEQKKGNRENEKSQLTDDDQLDEEAAGRMGRQLAFVQSRVALLNESDLQGPILSLWTERHPARRRPAIRHERGCVNKRERENKIKIK